MVKVKGLILLIALAMLVIILAGSSTSAVSDTHSSIADNNIPNDEIATSRTEASNSSASATITITWTTASQSDD